jgi:hypothetical protein
MTYQSRLLGGIEKFTQIVGQRAINPALIYAGEERRSVKGVRLVNYKNSSDALS